jgi:hypothetical protein
MLNKDKIREEILRDWTYWMGYVASNQDNLTELYLLQKTLLEWKDMFAGDAEVEARIRKIQENFKMKKREVSFTD